jgi:hypothetical protein
MPDYINTEGAGVMQLVLDLGMKSPLTVSAGSAGTPTRKSVEYEVEYYDKDKIHADVKKDGTRFPSIFVKGDSAGYLAQAQFKFSAPVPNGVYASLAYYKRDTDDWIRDVRTTQIPEGVDEWLVPFQVRLSDETKARVDLLNKSGTALTVSEAYLIMYK